MNDFIDWLWSLWEHPWVHFLGTHAGPFALGFAASWLTHWLAWRRFAAREFLHRVNFSLNYVENNQLRLRTLKESDIDQIILNNRHGRNMLLAAARRAKSSAKTPFLEMAPDDTFLVLNAILNELSQSFAAGALAKSMGLPVHSKWYVFGITCEWDDEVKNRKIRVMIIAEDLLESLDRLPPLEYQHPWHRVRHATLLTMLGLYREDCRAEAADRQQCQQREAQLAAMSDQQRSKALEEDRESEQRSPPVRNLMRVELGVS
jgi:hypothetical protein